MSEPDRQPGQLDPVDERRPEKIEGVDAEDQAGPADGAAADTVFLQPEAKTAPDQDPGKTADDPEEKDAGYAPLVIHSIHMTGVELQDEEGVNA